MNKTKIYILAAVALISTAVFYSSCNDKEEILTSESEFDQNSISSLTTGDGAEELMEFAAPSKNPYTISNMQRALDTLELYDVNCDLSLFDVRTTHKYIKFKPQDSLQYWELNSDSSLILFDYPLDRKLIKAGTYYRDPSVPEGQPNYQWTAVPADKQLPVSIPYDVLAELYIPEEDPALIQYYDTEFDSCITDLIEVSLLLTGNNDTTYSYEMTDDGMLYKRRGRRRSWRRPSKWNPSGRIQMFDNTPGVSVNRPVKGCKVRARRWFTMRSMLTNNSGQFSTSHQFRREVNYSIKWDRNDFEIRHKRTGQAYFNGPKIKGAWNLTINSGYSRMYAIIHRAAHRYYYEGSAARADLRQPPLKSQMIGKLTLGAFHWSQATTSLGTHNASRRWRASSEIRIFQPQRDCRGLFATTIHELAHASHWNYTSHSTFNNTETPVVESWARGVQWAITRLEYPGYRGGGVNLPNYTEVVIDLIDAPSIEPNNGFEISQGDSVANYTARQLENSLIGECELEDWRDAIINDHNNSTENEVSELFDLWF